MTDEIDALAAGPDVSITLTRDVSAICPVDGSQDHYTVRIDYQPDERIIELSSLSSYLDSFADREITQAQLCDTIRSDIERAIAPKSLTVELVGSHYGTESEVTA